MVTCPPQYMARVWANVSQQWVVTSSCNNCCRPTVLNAMLANNSSTVHPRVLRFLSGLSSRALAQHSVTRTKNFSTRPAPAASTTRTAPQQVQPVPAPHARQCGFPHPPRKCGYPSGVAKGGGGAVRPWRHFYRGGTMDYAVRYKSAKAALK